MLELVAEHQKNEHWWEVKNEDGDVGFAPSSYFTVKEETLPWLLESSLKTEEEERKTRVKRLAQEKAALEGTGLGPVPKENVALLPPKVRIARCVHDWC